MMKKGTDKTTCPPPVPISRPKVPPKPATKPKSVLGSPYLNWRCPFPCVRSLNRAFTFGELVLFVTWFITTGLLLVLAIRDHWSIKLSGAAAAVPTALAFALCLRNSFFTFFLGIPFERQLFWHKLMAYSAVSLGVAHGYLALDRNTSMSRNGNLSGILLGVAMILLIALSIPPIRRRFYRIFHASHVVLFAVSTGVGIWHGAKGIYFGVAVWGADFLVRFVYLTLIRNPRMCQAVLLPCDVVRLTFPKDGFKYCAGQYLFIMIPQINIFEWHPFSMSSAPHHDQVSIHIRAVGKWTRRLLELLPEISQSQHGGVNLRSKEVKLRVFMDGPYGSPEIDVDSVKYQLFLLISGGIGMTPMQSFCNQLVHEHEDLGRPMKKVVLRLGTIQKSRDASKGLFIRNVI